MMAELFERFFDMAKEDFGCTVVKSDKKSSFEDIFGFNIKDIKPPRTPKERGGEK